MLKLSYVYDTNCIKESRSYEPCYIHVTVTVIWLNVVRRYARCWWHLTLHIINVEKNVSRLLFHFFPFLICVCITWVWLGWRWGGCVLMYCSSFRIFPFCFYWFLFIFVCLSIYVMADPGGWGVRGLESPPLALAKKKTKTKKLATILLVINQFSDKIELPCYWSWCLYSKTAEFKFKHILLWYGAISNYDSGFSISSTFLHIGLLIAPCESHHVRPS